MWLIIHMNYFSYIGMTYAFGNNLHKAVFNFLETKNRQIIPADKITAWRKSVIDGIEKLNKEYKRCKPVQASWWQPGLHELKDWILSLGGGMICSFSVYQSR